MQNMRSTHSCPRLYLAEHSALRLGVFLEQLLLIKWSTVLLLLAHITGEPLRSTSPATFSNVRVHVRAI